MAIVQATVETESERQAREAAHAAMLARGVLEQELAELQLIQPDHADELPYPEGSQALARIARKNELKALLAQ